MTWGAALLAAGCGGAATDEVPLDESSEAGAGGRESALVETASTGGLGSTTGMGGSGEVTASVTESSVSSSAALSSSSVTTGAASTSAATISTTASATTGGPSTTGSASVSVTTASVSTTAVTTASATSATTATATTGETGTTGSGCECDAPENPELERIAYLTDPTGLHATCCDGCEFREALTHCIVAVECTDSYNFRVEWATCDGKSSVCADHGIAADPGENAGVIRSACSLRSSGQNEECEQISETEAACY